MNRELKFRAWIKDEGEMRYPSSDRYIKFNGDCYYIVRNLANSRKQIFQRENPDNIELMQYTGIKDRTGKEIYEGDIVELVGGTCNYLPCGDYSYHKFVIGDKMVVQNLKSGFTLARLNLVNNYFPNIVGKVNNYDFWNHHRSLKIVGNIFENPELLEIRNEKEN